MAVAFDATSTGSVTMPSGSYTHTPSGTPRGAISTFVGTSGGDNIDTCTYGGVSMANVAGSPNSLGTGETGQVHMFFLGASLPTGAQSIAVGGTGTSVYTSVTATVTAAADTEVVDSDGTINSTSIADPSVTLSLGGRTCWCALVLWSGQDATTGITPLTNWTATIENDRGTEVDAFYRYDTIGSTDVTAGWTQTAEDALMIAVAISEVVAGGGGTVIDRMRRGFGYIPAPVWKQRRLRTPEIIRVPLVAVRAKIAVPPVRRAS